MHAQPRALAFALALLAGCAHPGGPRPQATSLLGRPLHPVPLEPEEEAKRRAALAEAEAALQRNPQDEEAIIWVGRRQAYLGLYREAIETYTRGLAIHPASFRLLRHRGHRFITIRSFDQARGDLERAASLIRGVPDETEPDGMPNALNQPTSTIHANIYYHLGLVHVLRGEDEQALEAYEHCLDYCSNNDMMVATLYWTYLTLRRLGQEERAAALLDAITTDLRVIENTAYLRLLLLYKGALGPEELAPAGEDAVQATTEAYGLARWHEMRGDQGAFRQALERIVATDAWAAFGYVAAEADLVRMGWGKGQDRD